MLDKAGNDTPADPSGGVVSHQRPVDGRTYQASLSDRIRKADGIATMSVGGIVSHGDINTIVGAGRADMCALGRGYLEDAEFRLPCGDRPEFHRVKWPSQYRRAGEVRLRGSWYKLSHSSARPRESGDPVGAKKSGLPLARE